ncbi:MAG TPA: adenosylcobinamide-GDP ribazoletransferase, partial [Methanobacterium sp.]
DFGDAVMAHGDPEKRIQIMRDDKVGTTGMAYLFIVAIITFVSIASAPTGIIFFILLVSEVAAKLGLLTCSTLSGPYPNGTGKYFIEAMNPKMLLLSLVITLIIGYLVLNITGIVGMIGGLIGGFIMAAVVRRKFIYATGDILGASNEISRMVALLLMVGYLSVI